MIWASKSAMVRGLAAGLAAAALAGTAMAGPVVVRATGPSARAYPAGKQLADSAQLTLKSGDMLMLLDSRGTRTISGPGVFPAVATGMRAGTAQTAARILANSSSSERRGGAVRGGAPTGDTRSPNLWFVDLGKSGTMCIADPKAVRVWRASGAKAADVKVSSSVGTGLIVMPAGATVAEWPKTLPVADGAEYVVTSDGMAPAKVKFATVPMPASLEDTASALIAKGCKTQLDLLIATTAAGGSAG